MQFSSAAPFFTFFRYFFLNFYLNLKILATLGTVTVEYVPTIQLSVCEIPKEKEYVWKKLKA